MAEYDRRLFLAASASAAPVLAAMSIDIDVPGDMLHQIAGDQRRHVKLGPKLAGGAGDIATADWLAGELAANG